MLNFVAIRKGINTTPGTSEGGASTRVGKILEISISFSPRNLRIFENYPQLNLNWFMPFKPQNFSLILINGTLTLTSKIEDFWGSTSNKIFEEFSKNLKKII